MTGVEVVLRNCPVQELLLFGELPDALHEDIRRELERLKRPTFLEIAPRGGSLFAFELRRVHFRPLRLFSADGRLLRLPAQETLLTFGPGGPHGSRMVMDPRHPHF